MIFGREWTKKEDDYLTTHYKNLQYRDIGTVLDRSEAAVRSRRTKLGLDPKLPRIPVNCRYFDIIDTHMKAYLIGLLAADGWVGTVKSKGGGLLELSVSEKDVELVETIRDKLSPSRNICFSCNMAKFGMYPDSDMYMLLTEVYGIYVGRKETYSKPPGIPNEFLPSFWLGYFDGDGTLFHRKDGYWKWMLCGSELLMNEFVSDIDDITKSSPKVFPSQQTPWLHIVILHRFDDVHAVDSWIHQSGLGLERKKLPSNSVLPGRNSNRSS